MSPIAGDRQGSGTAGRLHALLTALRKVGVTVHFCLIAVGTTSKSAPASMASACDQWSVLARPASPNDQGDSEADSQVCEEATFWEAAFRLPVGDREPEAILCVGPEFVAALAGSNSRRLKLLAALSDREIAALTLPATLALLDQADAILVADPDAATALETRTSARVLRVGYWPNATTDLDAQEIGPGLTDISPWPLGDADALAAPDAFARAFRLTCPATPQLRASGADVEEVVFVGNEPDDLTAAKALELGLPVIGTAESFRGLPIQAAFHAIPDAKVGALVARRWMTEPEFRKAVADASAALAERSSLEVGYEIGRIAALLRRRGIDRPRALFVTDVPFWVDRIGNQRRIVGLLKSARQLFDVDVLVIPPASLPEGFEAARYIGAGGRCLPPTALEPELSPDTSAGATAWRRIAARGDHDVVIVEYVRLADTSEASLDERICVLDTHDIVSTRQESFELFGKTQNPTLDMEAELQAMSKFDIVICIQREDFEFVDHLFPNKALLVPYASDSRWIAPRDGVGRDFLLIGADSPMNRDGLQWFLEQVWPALVPYGATLHVAGEICRSVRKGDSIRVHGFVDDLTQLLNSTDIAINPVFYGGGLKIKSVEYISHGLPCVFTEEAIRGFANARGTPWLLARSRDEFLGACLALMQSASLRFQVSMDAFTYARANFSVRQQLAALRVLAAFSGNLRDRPRNGRVSGHGVGAAEPPGRIAKPMAERSGAPRAAIDPAP
jgi:hypothetical protein